MHVANTLYNLKTIYLFSCYHDRSFCFPYSKEEEEELCGIQLFIIFKKSLVKYIANIICSLKLQVKSPDMC